MLLDKSTWTDGYFLIYQHHSQKNQKRRARRREQQHARPAKKSRRAGLEPSKEELLADTARSRALSRKAVIEIRRRIGFRWSGGFIGGCRDYVRERLTYPGLVSYDTPILKLFVSRTRRAANLLTGDTKAEATGTDCKLLALDSAYVETSKLMRGVLRVEIDTIWSSWEALEAAILASGAPLPNVVVAYQDRAGSVWRPHLLWLLADSVCFTRAGNKRNQAAWKNALRGLTAKLLPIGADPGGLTNPDRHKNPLSPLWDRRILAAEPYSLDVDQREGAPGFAALRPHLSTRSRQSMPCARRPRRARPRAKRPALTTPIRPSPPRATRFSRIWPVLPGRASGPIATNARARREFEAEIAEEALAISPRGQRPQASTLQRAKRIADWTWNHYRVPQPKPSALSAEERRERLSAGAKAAAAVKRDNTLAAIAQTIRRPSETGSRPTQAAVAAATGKSLATVKRHWAAAIAGTAQGRISLP